MAGTRSTVQRLDDHDENLSQIHSYLEALKIFMIQGQRDMGTMQASMLKEQAAASEFRTFMLNWVKQNEKTLAGETGGSSNSSLFPPPTPTPTATPPPLPVEQFPLPPPPPTLPEDATLVGPPPTTLPWAAKKIQLPDFSGFDPQGWIQKASLYFEIHGLQDDVKKWVRLHRPSTRLEAMTLPRDVDQLLHPSAVQSTTTRFSRPYSNRPIGQNRSPTAPSTEFANLFNRNRGVRSLSRNEWEDRRKKGLCYRCGQQYGPCHKCPEGKLRILLLGDDEQWTADGTIATIEEIPEEDTSGEDPIPNGACMALEFFGATPESNSGGKSLKFEGIIGEIPAIIMVDSGATHNFISRKLLKVLGVASEFFTGINILLGDGHMVSINQQCPTLTIKVADCEFKVSALVFDMGHLDMVSGMEWLKTLGDVVHNWDKATMRFVYQGVSVYYRESRNNLSSRALYNLGYPCPHRPSGQKTEIKRQVSELLSLGMIRPSKRAFSSLVILVRKKDNSWRMCVDYRALNKATIPDKFPIPVVDELIDELHGAKFFSKLDLNSIGVVANGGGREELESETVIFHVLVEDGEKGGRRLRTAVVFFDDILIYSPTWQQHILDLECVLQILLQNHFVVNKKKCSFGQTAIEYLGHIINGVGVAMDPKKIDAVLDWPIPKNVKGLRGFLGLTGYYRKFIRHYGSIARPLIDLTKKDAFGSHSEAQWAFELLKEAMVTTPILGVPDF
ncbi:hypothetical protein LXL04_021390 [Taraxacum kok-saghyz]